jgi:hypothetical protein
VSLSEMLLNLIRGNTDSNYFLSLLYTYQNVMLYMLVKGMTQDTRLKNHKTTGVVQTFTTYVDSLKYVTSHKSQYLILQATFIYNRLAQSLVF